MIDDNPKEYWVWLSRRHSQQGVYYCPENQREYFEHWGKWLIFNSATQIRSLAEKLDPYIDQGEIDSAKFNREPSQIGRGDCVMCVYCDDRDKERIWIILRSIGLSKRIWKYDQQTYEDWKPEGRLQNRGYIYK